MGVKTPEVCWETGKMDRERDTSVTFQVKVDRGVVLVYQSRGDRIMIRYILEVVILLCDCLVFQA